MFKKGLLALTLVFSLLNTGSMFVFQSSTSKSTFREPSIFP